MITSDTRTEKILRSFQFFLALPGKDVDTLLAAGTVKSYTKHQHLFMHGDRAGRLFIVINGCVKVYSETKEGEESVINLITAGQSVGEASIFDGAIYPFSASAAESSEVFEISADILKSRAKQSPELTARIMALMSDHLHDLQREKEHLAIMTAAQRVGCMLLKLSANMIGKGGTFTLPYDKSLAASNLGMKPETFSRALKDLRDYGVSVKGSEITVADFSILAHHCCIHCSSITGGCAGDRREQEADNQERKRA